MPTVERGHSFCFALIAFGRATEIKYEGMLHVFFSMCRADITIYNVIRSIRREQKKVVTEKPLTE